MMEKTLYTGKVETKGAIQNTNLPVDLATEFRLNPDADFFQELVSAVRPNLAPKIFKKEKQNYEHKNYNYIYCYI